MAVGPVTRGRCSVGAVANYFLDAGERDGVIVTHLKLQKLVCIAYGFYLAAYEERLFGERIEAWDLGLVVPELYHELKRYGNHPIARKTVAFDHENDRFYIPTVKDSQTKAILEFVWKQHGRMSASQLVKDTHVEGGPWYNAVVAGESVVNDDDLRDYYARIIRELDAQ